MSQSGTIPLQVPAILWGNVYAVAHPLEIRKPSCCYDPFVTYFQAKSIVLDVDVSWISFFTFLD